MRAVGRDDGAGRTRVRGRAPLRRRRTTGAHAPRRRPAGRARRRPAGRAPGSEVAGRGEEGARLVRGPYRVGLREREATLVFDTPIPTSAEVRWGRDDDYGSSAHDAFGTHHVVRLDAL